MLAVVAMLGALGVTHADTGSPPPADAGAKAVAAEQAAARSRVCPQDTGTRIKQKAGDCQSSPGRTYGSDELRSTGAINTGEGLRKMDPSLTVTH
jgi:hypothetical protein